MSKTCSNEFREASQILRAFYCSQETRIAELATLSTCTKGLSCSKCCCNLINFSVLEAAVMLDALPVTGVINSIGDEVVNDLSLGLRRLKIVSTNKQEWFVKGWPCLFLTPSGLCSVYEDRAWVCRSYFVNSPPRDCRDSAGYVQQLLVTEGHKQYHQVMETIGHILPLPRGNIPAPLALYWAHQYLENGLGNAMTLIEQMVGLPMPRSHSYSVKEIII